MKKLLPLFMAFLVMAILAVAQPDITSGAGSYSVTEGQQLTINFAISNAEGTTTITKNVSFGALAPTSGSPLNASTFTWTPSVGQAGVYSILFTASNVSNSNTALATVTVNALTASMSSTALTLGDDNQARSNPRDDVDSQQEVNVTGTISITNTGTSELSGLQAAVSFASGFSASNLKPAITLSGTSIPIGGSVTAQVTMRVPEDLDSVTVGKDLRSVRVASITFTAQDSSANIVTAASTVDMEAEQMLDIRNAEVVINNDETKDIDEDTNIKNLKPDDELEVTIEVKNLFRDSDDVEIQDVSVRLEIDGLDVDEQEDLSDLGPTETDSITISFSIDSDIDEGTYDALIIVEGIDENGAKYSIEWNPSFEVERKTHEIQISSYSFSPSAISCDTSVSLRVTLKNIGTRDEDEVSLHLESPELSYGDVINDLVLDESDSTTKTFTIPVPTGLSAGVKRVVITTYYNTGTESNRETAVIQKSACVTETTTPKDEPTKVEPPVVVITPPADDTTTGGNVIAEPVVDEKSFVETSSYTALLILGYIVVIVVGIYLIGKVLRK